ncbi:MAG: hypothetical protein JOY55_01520 [Mycobacterium sp.]|nr:hypothetical protein [Mycobacterium sp.]MBV8290496.1 hypothetical protein [Mycobacterium sp.]
MTGTATANKSRPSTAWEQIDADEVSALGLRVARDAGLALTEGSDSDRLALATLFDIPTTSNFPRFLSQQTTSVVGPSALRFGRVLHVVELLAAIGEEDLHFGAATTDSYLYDVQVPIEVPEDWFAELRRTTVVVEDDFELPWADG